MNLVVTLGILAVLMILSAPMLRKMVAQGKSIRCVNTMRNLGTVVIQHAAEHNGRLPSYTATSYPYRQLNFVESVKRYLGDDPKFVACPANRAQVPRSSFDLGWMRYAYFGGIDPKLPNISQTNYNRWVEAGLVPNPQANRLSDPGRSIILTDQTTDPASMTSRADTNHLNPDGRPHGGNRLYLDGSIEFVPVADADVYLAAGRTLYR